MRGLPVLLALSILLLAGGRDAQAGHWAPLPVQFNAGGPRVFYVDTVENLLYIGGEPFEDTGHFATPMIWDGRTLTLMPQVPGIIISAFSHYHGTLYAGTNKGVCRFNGTGWDMVAKKLFAESLTVFDDKLLIVGDWRSDYADGNTCAVLYNDADSSFSSLHDLHLAIDSNSRIESVVVYKGQIYAAGNIIPPTTNQQLREIVRFDGTGWTDVGGGIQSGGLGVVAQMLVWKDELYVAGEFMESAGAPGNCIAKWDGQKWSRLGDGVGNSISNGITNMTVYHDNLYVAGVFHTAGGVPAEGLARWDGNKWCGLGDTASNAIFKIQSYKNDFYVAGVFLTIDRDSFSHIARWTGGDYVSDCSLKDSIFSIPSVLTVYPNPAGESFSVNKDVRSIELYDVNGRLVKKWGPVNARRLTEINELPQGLYILRIIKTDGFVFYQHIEKR